MMYHESLLQSPFAANFADDITRLICDEVERFKHDVVSSTREPRISDRVIDVMLACPGSAQFVSHTFGKKIAQEFCFTIHKQNLLTERKRRENIKRQIQRAIRRIMLPPLRQNESSVYPRIPRDWVVPSKDGNGLPDTPGIYFVWRLERVAYVGQSKVGIKRRATLSHGKVYDGDVVSAMPWHVDDLFYAEAYYIGILRPWRNFSYTPYALEVELLLEKINPKLLAHFVE